MKKLLLTLSIGLITFIGNTQEYSADTKIELTAFTGYQTSGTINFYEGKYKAEDGQNWGAILGVKIRPHTFVEFTWSQINTDYVFYPYAGYGFGSEEIRTKGKTDFFLLGATQEHTLGSEKVLGLTGLSFGAASFSYSDRTYNSTVQFAMGVNLGVKVFLSEHVALRAQGRFLMPMYFNGVFVSCGGGGCGSGVSSTVTLIQGDFTAGLVIAI